jgi:hypothetical protein
VTGVIFQVSNRFAEKMDEVDRVDFVDRVDVRLKGNRGSFSFDTPPQGSID